MSYVIPPRAVSREMLTITFPDTNLEIPKSELQMHLPREQWVKQLKWFGDLAICHVYQSSNISAGLYTIWSHHITVLVENYGIYSTAVLEMT